MIVRVTQICETPCMGDIESNPTGGGQGSARLVQCPPWCESIEDATIWIFTEFNVCEQTDYVVGATGMPRITIDELMELAEVPGYSVRQIRLTKADVLAAREVGLTIAACRRCVGLFEVMPEYVDGDGLVTKVRCSKCGDEGPHVEVRAKFTEAVTAVLIPAVQDFPPIWAPDEDPLWVKDFEGRWWAVGEHGGKRVRQQMRPPVGAIEYCDEPEDG